jgi:hypothetical protein
MEIQVEFTAHALNKFDILRRHGIDLTLDQVRQIVLSPVLLDRDALGNPIAQGALEQIPIWLVGFGIEHLCGSVRKPAKALIPFPQTDVESALDATHVLRVVYREEKEQRRVVITFYPGRRERYENKL